MKRCKSNSQCTFPHSYLKLPFKKRLWHHVATVMLLMIILTPGISSAQVSFTGTYSQNFDGMGTGTVIPTGWSHIGRLGGSATSWTTSIPSSGNPSAASAGTVNNTLISATNNFSGSSNNQAYNYSDATTTNRALGTSPTSGAGNILQLSLTNNTGSALSSIQLAYQIRRFANAVSAETLPGYRLFVNVNGTATWTSVAALNPTATTVPNTVGTSPFTINLTLPSTVASGGQIRLRWVDDNSSSSALDQRIGLDNVQISLNAPPPSCGTPTQLLASGITTTSALLSWQPVSGAQTYNLRWKPTSGTTFTSVNGITGLNYVLSGLIPGTSYDFQVQAICSTSTAPGSFSPLFSFITEAVNPTCTTANNLNASAISSTSALLTWTSGLDAYTFNLRWKPESATTFNFISNIVFTSYQLNGLLPGTNYVYQVQTVCGGEEENPAVTAPYSAPFFFTTSSVTSGRPAINSTTNLPDITIWPNPVSGNQLELRMHQPGIKASVAAAELFDLPGKRISVYTLPMASGRLYARINLPRSLPGGIYMLRITAGERQFSKRLIIR